jgi:hypothetical protein
VTEQPIITFLSQAVNSMTDEDQEVDPDATLGDVWSILGLESIDQTDFEVRIEKSYGFRIKEALEENPAALDGKPLSHATLRDVARLVLAARTRH